MPITVVDLNTDCLLRVVFQLDNRVTSHVSNCRDKIRISTSSKFFHELIFSYRFRSVWRKMEFRGSKMKAFFQFLDRRVSEYLECLDLIFYGYRAPQRKGTDNYYILEDLPVMPNLKTLRLFSEGRARIDTVGEKVPELSKIAIYGKLGNGVVKSLVNHFPKLEEVDLSSYRRHSKKLIRSFLLSKSQLKVLALPGVDAGEVCVHQVARWLSALNGSAERLISLKTGLLRDTDVVNGVGLCMNLEHLSLCYRMLSDIGLMALAGLRKLKSLNLYDLNATDRRFYTWYPPTHSKVTEKGLAKLLGTATFQLRTFEIDDRCDDSAVDALIGGNPDLERIDLAGCFTANGFANINSLKNLQSVRCKSRAFDESVLDMLDPDRLPNFAKFSAAEMKVSSDVRNRFKEVFPTCDIFFYEEYEDLERVDRLDLEHVDLERNICYRLPRWPSSPSSLSSNSS